MTNGGPARTVHTGKGDKRGMLKTLGGALRAHWRNTLYWGLCALLGGLLPLWITLFVRRIYERPMDVQSFVLRGDVVLYAAAFLAPAIYQVAVRMKDEGSILAVGAVITAVIALLMSAIVYVVMNPGIVPGGPPLQIHNYRFINEVSCGLLLLSLMLSICVFLNEQQLQFEAFDRAEKHGQETLGERVAEANPQPANVALLAPLPGADVLPPEAELKERFREDEHV